MPFDSSPIRSAYLAGEYSLCRQLLTHAPQPAAQLWLARVEYRSKQFDSMLERLLNLAPPDERFAAERDSWLAAAYANIGQFDLAHELLDRAFRILAPPDEAYYRALYIRATAYAFVADEEAAISTVNAILESPSALDRGLAYCFRALRGAHLDPSTEAADYLLSLDEFESAGELDQYAFVHTLLGLSVLCRETAVPGLYERLQRALPRLHESEATDPFSFLLHRNLGWIDALRGNELAAVRCWETTRKRAPSDFWRVYSLVDQAYLAKVMGRSRTARKALHAAHQLSASLTWNSTFDSERIILVTIAQLFADEDPVLAQRYLAQYRSLSTQMHPTWIFAGRTRALQLHPHGVAMVRLGERESGIEMIEEAWRIFASVEYDYRAAIAAFDLYEATGEERWRRIARDKVAPWPNSWLARSV